MSDVDLTVIVEDRGKIRARMQNQSEKNARETRFEGVLDKLSLDTIDIFENMLREGRVTKPEELQVLGRHLYRILFNEEVEAFFQQALKQVTNHERLRVQLTFEEKAADLANLPWEYLYYPATEHRRGFFLATHIDLVLSRYMPLEAGSLNLAPVESSLRILIVISNPKELGFAVVTEPIIKAMEKLGERYSITFDRLEKPTIDNFIDKLEKFKPHVLHFFGHGHYNKEEEKAEIALLDVDEESVAWLTDKYFTDCFIRARPVPRLVFLHLCESSTINFNANFERLAPELIRANIQAVVAMRYPIATKDATAFCRTFYEELAEGEPVDAAVQEGRYRITTNNNKSRLFGTPVLYMQTCNSIVQPTASIVSKGSRDGSTAIHLSKQDVGVTQTGPLVNEVETSNANTSVAQAIILEGRKTIEKMTDPPVEMYKMLVELGDQLTAKNTSEEMKSLLTRKLFEVDNKFRPAILAMMAAVSKIL